MKKILNIVFVSLCIFLLFSCNRNNEVQIPAYIKIDTCSVEIQDYSTQGSASHNIKDVWVYVGNQLQGIYELPAFFPILENGPTDISVRAGIFINGISETRIYYPFYERFFNGETNLVEGEITTINPVFKYLDNEFITYEWMENYENMLTRLQPGKDSDTTINIVSGNDSFEGVYSGNIVLENNRRYFELYTTPAFENIPIDGRPVYLELDYKCDSAMIVGVQAIFPDGSTLDNNIVYIRETDTWKKMYINLTSTLVNFYEAKSFKVFIKGGSIKYENINRTNFYWDNIKLVY